MRVSIYILIFVKFLLYGIGFGPIKGARYLDDSRERQLTMMKVLLATGKDLLTAGKDLMTARKDLMTTGKDR